mgnify:CR=1 FL=1
MEIVIGKHRGSSYYKHTSPYGLKGREFMYKRLMEQHWCNPARQYRTLANLCQHMVEAHDRNSEAWADLLALEGIGTNMASHLVGFLINLITKRLWII